MKYIDVFNGDADGICALHQLRLANPVDSTLVTGVKRDISLLKQVKPEGGDRVTVLDISLDKNRDDLVRVLDEGASVGNAQALFPQDEDDRLAAWLALANEHNVELVLCISSALKRGILDEAEAQRHEKTGATAHPAFTIGGLGQFVDASAQADRLVTFGG